MSKCRIMCDRSTPYHMVRSEDGWHIYRASQFDGDNYNGGPIFSGDDEDCRDWFYDRDITDFAVVRRACLVDPSFLDDLVGVADQLRSTLDGLLASIGWCIRSDCFLRHSQRHCYSDGLGGTARLVRVCDKSFDSAVLERATNDLVYLIGMSRAAYELGFILSYDETGRHKLTAFPRYVIDMEG